MLTAAPGFVMLTAARWLVTLSRAKVSGVFVALSRAKVGAVFVTLTRAESSAGKVTLRKGKITPES